MCTKLIGNLLRVFSVRSKSAEGYSNPILGIGRVYETGIASRGFGCPALLVSDSS